jgi:integrase
MKGHLRQRGKRGVWYLYFDEARERGKKREQQGIRLGTMPKNRALARMREILREVDQGTWVKKREDINVSDFLIRWLDANKDRIAPTTYARYSGLVSLHFVPEIGSVMLRKVTPDHIRQIDRRLVEKKLSARSRLHAYRALHTAFTWGVRENQGMLEENVVRRVKAPSIPDSAVSPFTHEKVRDVLEAVRGTRLEIPVIVAAVTGLRRGELLALKWGTVNLEGASPSLYVEKALEHTRAYGIRFKAPKTAKSRAVLPLAPDCVTLLLQHREEQREVKATGGVAYRDLDLVFPNPDGAPWPPDSFSVQFGRLVRSAGCQGFRLHDLRHGFATLMLASGVNVKEVSGLLRHSREALTLTTYAHPVEGASRIAVSNLARTLLQPKVVQSP